jgi:hypothetical protein
MVRTLLCCTDSMHERMPRSKSWASPGGIAPTAQSNIVETKKDTFKRRKEDNKTETGNSALATKQRSKRGCQEEEGDRRGKETRSIGGYMDRGWKKGG